MVKLLSVIPFLLFASLTWADEPPLSDLTSEVKAEQQTGYVYGHVVDKGTHKPIPGAGVLIEGTRMGAGTDTAGVFRIERVPVGSHNLRFMMLGYETLVKSNVVVPLGRGVLVEAALKEVLLEMGMISVRASYFEKARDAVVTTRTMDFEEIRQDPGSSADIQRVMQALPAVVSGSDQQNEIIVRGGIPGENLFLMDAIEIPNPNHFAYQGTGGGPINMINTYFVREVDFMAGSFPAKYGDKVSSVMDISLREGNRERMEGSFDLGMAGAGVMAEGPLTGRKGSYLLSARKSFLDLIISSTGLTAVPHYYSLQGKVVYDLNDNNRLLVNAIYGNDEITIEEEKEEEASGYTGGADNVRSLSYQYAAGVTLRSLWKKGFSDLTLSRALNHWDQFVYDSSGYTYYTNLSTESENTAKFDWVHQFSKEHETAAGVSYKQVRADHDIWADADTLFVWDTSFEDAKEDTILSIFRTYPVWEDKKDMRSGKVAAYLQHKWRPGKVTLNLGLRYDRFAYNDRAHLGPRVGLAYALTAKTSLNLAYGDHYQSPAYIDLTANPKNKTLDYKRTWQYVLGIEHLFREDTKATLEVYYKEYSNVPIPRSWTTPDPFDSFQGELLSEGRGDARGVEFFLQRKMSGSFQGTISYSYSRSRAFDPRFQEYYDWDYDYRHVFTAISSYRWKLMNRGWYQRIKEKLWYKIFSWVIPLGDETVFSFRWRYLGGRPYTKPIYHREWHAWITEEDQRLNTGRHPIYHRLDLRLDRRFMLGKWNMVTYFDLQNVYDRTNIWGYQYEEDGNEEPIEQYKVFPIGGLTIEF